MTIRDKRAETEREPTPKQLTRRKRTIELSCNGLNVPQINKALHDEGFQTSEHTVFDDLHSRTAEEYLEELKRQQLADITRAQDDYKTRLQYRGQMIEILSPRRIEAKTEANGTIKFDMSTQINELIKISKIDDACKSSKSEP